MTLCKLFILSLTLAPFLLIAGKTWAAPIPTDLNAAVVYAYFRIGNDESDVPSITPNSFAEQITEMSNENNGYHVLSLDSIINAQEQHTPLSPRSIALTFEGTDASFLHQALPLLRDNKLPFTVFVSPGLLDMADKTNSDDYLHWSDVRHILSFKNATIGMSAYTYGHIDGKTGADLTADLNRARTRFREELKTEPRYFSYPFGEYTQAFMDAVSKQEFVASFGQQSGVVDETQSRIALPRFSMTDDFSDVERFRLTSTSLPLPLEQIATLPTMLSENPPQLTLKISTALPNSDIAKIACFASGMGNIPLKKEKNGIINVAFPKKFEDYKGRVNCTIPAPSLDGGDEPRWRWLGFLFIFPEDVSATSQSTPPKDRLVLDSADF